MTPDSLSLRRYGSSHAGHSHDHFQVLVGVSGVLELEVEGRGQRIAAGEGWLVAPGERHDFESRNGSQCLVLDSGADLWSRCAGAPARPQQVSALAGYLAQALAQPQPLAAQHGPALLLEAWLPAQPAGHARRQIHWPALAAWVQSRLHLPLAVDDLAQRVHLSPSQFTLRCHQAQGMSPMHWLRAQRLVHARLLRAGGLPVAEVARRCGYRSPSALTAALRRQGGC